MAVNVSNKTSEMQRNIINITLLYPEINWTFHEVKNIVSKKKTFKASLLKFSNKMNPAKVSYGHKLCAKHWTNPLPTPTSLASYPQTYSYPLVSEWHQFQTPLLTVQPIPVIVPAPTPIFAPQLCPYSSLVQPVLSPIIQAYIPEEPTIVNFSTESLNCCVENYSEQILNLINNQICYGAKVVVTELEDIDNELKSIKLGNAFTKDGLEFYLSLPKYLFPPARTFAIDPNPIIDEFCKMSNIQHHTPWLLDLEFGIPKSPITRPIPIYNVKFNSIHCKNAPDAIHPSFETCEPDFKRILLFYYDCIVSAWYRGYISMNYDRSVENFQSWLLLPMQVLGMCWP